MDPIYLQKQIRDNNSDLMNFCADLKQWGEEMKHTDKLLNAESNPTNADVPLVRTKVKKQKDEYVKKPSVKKSKRIKGVDYVAWEKYDVDAECAKLDERKSEDDESGGELTDECDETLREEAIYEKEKGNKFVKKGSWNQAIECYTKAVQCYAYDPIFYANRALCHLKNLDYRLAESDCTTAIQLDKTYVKAYHRRAQAREALNQLREAHDDLLKVFDYEPDNKESKNSLAKLEKKLESVAKKATNATNDAEQKPKSKFTLSRQQQRVLPHKTVIESSTSTECANVPYWPSGNNIELITAVSKAPHLRSKALLRRINIRDSETITTSVRERVVPQPLPTLTSNNCTIKCDDFKVVERKTQICPQECTPNDNKHKSKLVPEKQNHKNSFSFTVPETSVQFNYDWRLLKDNSEWRYLYLKQINPKNLKKIFDASLECDVFSGIIGVLAEKFIGNNNPVHEYLLELCGVKRFDMLAMFMTDNDKKDLQKLFDYMHSDRNVSGTDIGNLMNKYSL